MPDVTTCMEAIKTSTLDDNSPSQLVVGTELKNVYILD